MHTCLHYFNFANWLSSFVQICIYMYNTYRFDGQICNVSNWAVAVHAVHNVGPGMTSVGTLSHKARTSYCADKQLDDGTDSLITAHVCVCAHWRYLTVSAIVHRCCIWKVPASAVWSNVCRWACEHAHHGGCCHCCGFIEIIFLLFSFNMRLSV